MDRTTFHKTFKSAGPVVLPVIHVLTADQAFENIRILIREGAAGCFLINHDFGVDQFLPIIERSRETFPSLWLGVNFLAVTGREAFPILGELQSKGCEVDGYWADDARINELGPDQKEAQVMADMLATGPWKGLYFGGTAFKKQREVSPDHYEEAARAAVPFMDVVTTSGVATGKEADHTKITDFRRGIGSKTLALASGITPENAETYHDVDCFMVATGINKADDFYNIDPARLRILMQTTRRMGANE